MGKTKRRGNPSEDALELMDKRFGVGPRADALHEQFTEQAEVAEMLLAARKRSKLTAAMTIREFYREVAKLGGFLGRKSDSEPGWITIWRGWQKLYMFIHGAELAQTIK